MLWRGLLAAALVAALDQASKAAVLGYFHQPDCGHGLKTITSFFDLVLTCNKGVSFGLLNRIAGSGALLLSLAAVGMIVGGALGNVVDRVRFGGVVDFLSFHLPGAQCSTLWDGCWPAFNLADSAITLGAILLVVDELRRVKKS